MMNVSKFRSVQAHAILMHSRTRKLLTIDLTTNIPPLFVTMTPEQLNQIADQVKTSLLNGIDREVDAAMTTLGINAELSDEEWQALIDMILT